MIRLTNLADYAVVLSCELAHSQGVLQSANELSERSGIPVPTVSKILGALSRADILNSQRGLGGGFCLARAPETITVADIVEAIDGPVSLTACADGEDINCTLIDECTMQPHWHKINSAVRDALAAVTLAEILTSPKARNDSHSDDLDTGESGTVADEASFA